MESINPHTRFNVTQRAVTTSINADNPRVSLLSSSCTFSSHYAQRVDAFLLVVCVAKLEATEWSTWVRACWCAASFLHWLLREWMRSIPFTLRCLYEQATLCVHPYSATATDKILEYKVRFMKLVREAGSGSFHSSF